MRADISVVAVWMVKPDSGTAQAKLFEMADQRPLTRT
jgi:hypothetical protein